MALGAASTGAKVLVSSSSCAVALMQETLSYAASDELPIVLVNVMRAGPGQGYIYPSQGDYNQATIGGGNGDYKTIVLAPSSVQECIDLTYKAFNLSQKYRIPTILLLDGLLGQMSEPAILKENPYPKIDTSSWNLTGAKNRDSRKIHSLESDPKKLCRRIGALHQKHTEIEKNEPIYEEYKCDDADFIITAFGTMARIAKAVCDYYRYIGFNFGVFIPKTLYPFPKKRLFHLSHNAHCFFDIEMNLGQMYQDIQKSLSPDACLHFIGKPAGEWLKEDEIIKIIDGLLQGKYATNI
jgi:2-oxoglutarate ferredoxin oxidoreductase subunit alpha